MKTNENKETLGNFSWDSWGDKDNQLFEKPSEVKEEVVEEKGESKEESKEEPKEELKKEDKDVSFTEDDFETPEVDEEEDANPNSTIINKLREDNIFSVLEDDEDFTEGVSDKDIPDLLDREVEARVEETMETFFGEMDDDAVAFLKFKQSGGNTAEFFKAYAQYNATPTGTIDDESYQEQIVRHGLANEGKDSEEIDDYVEHLKETAKLKKHAEKYEVRINKANEIEKQKILKQQEATDKKNREQRNVLSENLKTKLEEVDSIGDFTFNKKDKRTLHTYMTKARVRVGKNEYVTQMQSDLSKAFQDPEKILIIAKLLSNDFDVSDIKRDTETKVTRKTKDKIERKSNKMQGSSSTVKKGRKALYEYFNK